MFRVVCVDDKNQHPECNNVCRGKIYTVVNEEFVPEQMGPNGIYYDPGVYYELLEMGPEALYHSCLFVRIEEDQQDETEMERDYEKVKIENR